MTVLTEEQKAEIRRRYQEMRACAREGEYASFSIHLLAVEYDVSDRIIRRLVDDHYRKRDNARYKRYMKNKAKAYRHGW